ncbi:hypothetical protein FBALC1_13022 [Flavobacteriales bacterium ALC-1]|nr:hypothetical protein FBALC1_13022 [Flavobacteriales bacterium ALC-1]
MHLGIIILLLAFFGRYIEESSVPNQQIVIQFSDKDVAKEDANNAIEIVKKQLEIIGAKQIQIVQNDNGQLKITYYSDSDVKRIQNILSQEEGYKFAYNSKEKSSTNFPKEKSGKDYELNISEIQNNNDSNWDFERTEVVELNQKSEHSYNPKVNTSGELQNTEHNNSIVKVALQVNKSVVIVTDNTSYKIPEVRAGPTKREFTI